MKTYHIPEQTIIILEDEAIETMKFDNDFLEDHENVEWRKTTLEQAYIQELRHKINFVETEVK
jgi:hypothetical protein